MSERDEWLEWRRGGVGASEVAAVCNLPGAFGTAFDRWADKTGKVTEREQTDRMRFGVLLEPVIAGEFQRETGLYVTGEQTWCTHPEHAHHRATVDGFVAESPNSAIGDVLGVYEAKTGQANWHDLPDAYTCQVQWQLHVTGLAQAWVAYLRAGFDFSVHEVKRDDELIAVLVARVDEFWQHVLDDTPPEPTWRSDVAPVFPPVSVDSIDFDDAGVLLWSRAVGIRRDIRYLEHELDKVRNDLRVMLNGHEVGTIQGAPAVTNRNVARRSFDTEALERDLPEVAERYRRETTSPTLLIKEKLV